MIDRALSVPLDAVHDDEAALAKRIELETSEFQFIANRFDATQGRSVSAQVNAVGKSGTNGPVQPALIDLTQPGVQLLGPVTGSAAT